MTSSKEPAHGSPSARRVQKEPLSDPGEPGLPGRSPSAPSALDCYCEGWGVPANTSLLSGAPPPRLGRRAAQTPPHPKPPKAVPNRGDRGLVLGHATVPLSWVPDGSGTRRGGHSPGRRLRKHPNRSGEWHHPAGGSKALGALGTPPSAALPSGWKGSRSCAPPARSHPGATLSRGLARVGPSSARPWGPGPH